jgi:hypothetical protein
MASAIPEKIEAVLDGPMPRTPLRPEPLSPGFPFIGLVNPIAHLPGVPAVLVKCRSLGYARLVSRKAVESLPK